MTPTGDEGFKEVAVRGVDLAGAERFARLTKFVARGEDADAKRRAGKRGAAERGRQAQRFRGEHRALRDDDLTPADFFAEEAHVGAGLDGVGGEAHGRIRRFDVFEGNDGVEPFGNGGAGHDADAGAHRNLALKGGAGVGGAAEGERDALALQLTAAERIAVHRGIVEAGHVEGGEDVFAKESAVRLAKRRLGGRVGGFGRSGEDAVDFLDGNGCGHGVRH